MEKGLGLTSGTYLDKVLLPALLREQWGSVTWGGAGERGRGPTCTYLKVF